jgi:hypothetical protein
MFISRSRLRRVERAALVRVPDCRQGSAFTYYEKDTIAIHASSLGKRGLPFRTADHDASRYSVNLIRIANDFVRERRQLAVFTVQVITVHAARCGSS